MKPLLLFDLGGVIVEWTGIFELSALSGLSVEDAAAKFAAAPTANAYERGEIGDDEFTRFMIDSFNLPYSPAQFKLQWRLWVGDTFPNAVATIRTLGSQFSTACLSNTNAMHWAHLKTYADPDAIFDHAFASHLIGAIKPDVRAFEIVCERTGFAPKDVVFFDDSQINVDAARGFGMTAHKVDPELGVIPTLARISLD